MKTRIIFSSFFILIFILSSCGQETTTRLPVTQTPIATQLPTHILTQTSISTSIHPTYIVPTADLFSTPTPIPTVIPYPTASVVQANAVAFIDRVGLDYSLWIANVDGSGERKLADIMWKDIKKDSLTNILMQWSPNGKWISYRSNDDLWMVSRDGSVKRKLIPFPDRNIGRLYTYAWSPDSSQIAYIQTANPWAAVSQIIVGILDLETGKVSEISSHEAPDPKPISWSPDGRYLLFAKDFSYTIYEVAASKVVKEIKPNGMGCWVGWSIWSPNNKWFFDTQHGNGRYFRQWICVSGLDGLNRKIYVEGTVSTPVWDKTGDFLYFVARKTNPDSDPNLKIEEWLMRYDVRTQKAERLLPLREQQSYGYIGSVSISPDGNTLEIHTQTSESQIDYIFIDLKSFSVKNLTLDSICTWSADSKNFICASQLNNYLTFYKFNIETKETNIFSGEHLIESWRVSPIATTP